MRKFQNVRFRLTEFLRAAHAMMELETGEPGPFPAVPDAFTWYWNWCIPKGWKLEAVTMVRDTRTATMYLEQNAQLNIRCEEYWNIVWSSDEAPQFDPDIVHGNLEGLHRMVAVELRERGWDEIVGGQEWVRFDEKREKLFKVTLADFPSVMEPFHRAVDRMEREAAEQ